MQIPVPALLGLNLQFFHPCVFASSGPCVNVFVLRRESLILLRPSATEDRTPRRFLNKQRPSMAGRTLAPSRNFVSNFVIPREGSWQKVGTTKRRTISRLSCASLGLCVNCFSQFTQTSQGPCFGPRLNHNGHLRGRQQPFERGAPSWARLFHR